MALGRKRHHIFKVPASGSPSDNLLNSFEIMNIPSSLPYRWNNSFKWWWTAIKMYSYLTSQSFSITFNCTQYITVLHLRGQYISYFNPETLKKKIELLTSSTMSVAMARPISLYDLAFPCGPKRMNKNLCNDETNISYLQGQRFGTWHSKIRAISPGGHRHLSQTSKCCSLGQADKGNKGFVEEIHFSHQHVGSLSISGDLLHEFILQLMMANT